MSDIAVIEVVQGTDVVEILVSQPKTVIDVVDLGDPVQAVDVEVVEENPIVEVINDHIEVFVEVVPSEQVIDVELIRQPLVSIDIEVQVMPGPEGPEGPPANAFAEGVQVLESTLWIMDYALDGKPAAFRFFDDLGAEIEPAEITYVNPSRSVAQWPEPISGSWIIS